MLSMFQNFEDLTENDLEKSLKSMKKDKFPDKNDLTKEFCKTFWVDMKGVFVAFIREV